MAYVLTIPRTLLHCLVEVWLGCARVPVLLLLMKFCLNACKKFDSYCKIMSMLLFGVRTSGLFTLLFLRSENCRINVLEIFPFFVLFQDLPFLRLSTMLDVNCFKTTRYHALDYPFCNKT